MYIDPLNAIGPSGGPDLQGYFNRPEVRTALGADASPNKVYHMEIGNNGYDQVLCGVLMLVQYVRVHCLDLLFLFQPVPFRVCGVQR